MHRHTHAQVILHKIAGQGKQHLQQNIYKAVGIFFKFDVL